MCFFCGHFKEVNDESIEKAPVPVHWASPPGTRDRNYGFAAGENMTTYMIDLSRANDPNKAGWGHSALNFLGGWSTGENDSFSVHTQDAFNGRAIYCIEPGVGVNTGDQYTGRGEDFWDNYPST